MDPQHWLKVNRRPHYNNDSTLNGYMKNDRRRHYLTKAKHRTKKQKATAYGEKLLKGPRPEGIFR